MYFLCTEPGNWEAFSEGGDELEVPKTGWTFNAGKFYI